MIIMLLFRIATFVAFLHLIRPSIGLPIDVTDVMQQLDSRSFQPMGNLGVPLSRREQPELVTRDFGDAAKAAVFRGVLAANDVVSGVGDGVTAVGNGIGEVTGKIRNGINKNMPTQSQINNYSD
ncbi:hypothetical protein F5887DRAFT_249519 [Amanita rubescens]|nr:hypothetical protein F5887DRAFT_523163 [Amanita rubescens]KAF8344699.1 hypothetical protein F5887DRAFT_249519 [Amanita rubescens]